MSETNSQEKDMAGDDIRLQRLQFQLLLSYISLEETVRRWHPEVQWTQDQVAAFNTERHKRDDTEADFIRLMWSTCRDSGTAQVND